MKAPAPLKVQKLDFHQREGLIERLKEESKASHGFYLFLSLSVIITTFGLLLNSAAVIIGGMIIAPLLYPLIGVGMAVVTNSHSLLKHTVGLIIKSTIVVVVLSWIVTLFTPFNEVTNEISIRTTPTLIDLIVALASGAAGAYAVSEKERFASLTGVAVAAALVPPLAITGFAIATGNYELVWGSFILYAANLISVIVASSVVFSLLGFPKVKTKKNKKDVTRNVTITLAFFMVILFVLSMFFYNAITNMNRQKIVEQTVKLFLEDYKDARLISLSEKQNVDRYIISVMVQAPSSFYQGATSRLESDIEDKLGYDIDLKFFSIPVIQVQ